MTSCCFDIGVLTYVDRREEADVLLPLLLLLHLRELPLVFGDMHHPSPSVGKHASSFLGAFFVYVLVFEMEFEMSVHESLH